MLGKAIGQGGLTFARRLWMSIQCFQPSWKQDAPNVIWGRGAGSLCHS